MTLERATCNGRETSLHAALANLKGLAANDYKVNLGKIIHDVYQTVHVMFGDMPQGDHKERAKYRFATKNILRIVQANMKKED